MEGGTVYGLTAALKGEITIQNGRVVQRHFNDYQMLRHNDTPEVETHIVAERRDARRDRRTEHRGRRRRAGQRRLRRDRQAHLSRCRSSPRSSAAEQRSESCGGASALRHPARFSAPNGRSFYRTPPAPSTSPRLELSVARERIRLVSQSRSFWAQRGRYQRSGGSGGPKTNHQTPGMALLRGRMSTMRTTAIVSAIPARRTKKNEWLHRSQ